MKIMLSIMKMLPVSMARRMSAPMIAKPRLETGRKHPTIQMNLSNLLVCAEYCGTCPSNPEIKGENALYCATGKSSAKIVENGCNCVECPLLDKCSARSTAYFCKDGACAPNEDIDTKTGKPLSDRAKYLNRFQVHEKEQKATEVMEKRIQAQNVPVDSIKDVSIDFVGDKEVKTKSNIPLLYASLEAGIAHTHVCGGRAKCSTCRVIVTEGLMNCNPRNEAEAHLAHRKGFTPEVRLACQTTIGGNISARRLVLDAADISEAIGEHAEAGGREANVSILFSDIRDFTAFSEKALPYDIIHILNRYFDTIGEYIDQNGGYIDKYMGDGIMAIFGLDHKSQQNPPLYAVQSAYKIVRGLKEFNKYLKSHFNTEFRIGIGIHTGEVIIGNLGYRKKKDLTAIGDTVNTASRIEALTKKAGTPVLVSENTYILVKDSYKWGRQFKASVKGKAEPITVYEPLFDL